MNGLFITKSVKEKICIINLFRISWILKNKTCSNKFISKESVILTEKTSFECHGY